MATVVSKTSMKIDDLLDPLIIDAEIVSGNLIFTTIGGATINAGPVQGTNVRNLWDPSTAYVENDIVGYAGRLYISMGNATNKVPALEVGYWTPLTGVDVDDWSSIDPTMEGGPGNWDTSVKTGTSTVSYISGGGFNDTIGIKAMKVQVNAASLQRICSKEENIVRGGEVIICTVRCKSSSGGAFDLDVQLLCSDAASAPVSGGSGVMTASAAEGTKVPTTSYVDYTFTMVASSAKPRAKVHLIIENQSGSTASLYIDSIRVARANKQALAAYPIGSVYMGTTSTNPALLLGGGTWSAFGTGKMPIGLDPLDADFDTAEETGGSKEVTLTSGNLPPHAHSINHTHTISVRDAAGGAQINNAAGGGGASTILQNNAPSTHTGNSGNGPGSSDPVDNLPPFIAVYMWKRTA